MELKRGELYKFEITKDRYEIHKEQLRGANATLTIEDIENQWGIFALKRCYRSFNEKYMIELQFLYPVESAEHGQFILRSLNKMLEKEFKREIKTETIEYYE